MNEIVRTIYNVDVEVDEEGLTLSQCHDAEEFWGDWVWIPTRYIPELVEALKDAGIIRLVE